MGIPSLLKEMKKMREKILNILVEHEGRFVSGEEISALLGVTRAAIWKHIKAFREEGYPILSSSKKGYSLLCVPDRMEEAFIRNGMKTVHIGKKIFAYPSIDSTNTKAKELAMAGAPHGTLVLAEEQTMGKGRMGRRWVSPYGTGIWMSVILRPDIDPLDAPKMTMLGALAAARAVWEITGLEAGIKWPNDIILSRKKVCGILTEMSGDMDTVHWIVMGIGMNVNTPSDVFPADIQSVATSLLAELGQKTNRIRLIRCICEKIEAYYERWVTDKDFSAIVDECRRLSVTLGQKVRVNGVGVDFTGKAVDIDSDGVLLVQKDDGSMEKVISGDVSVRGVLGYV